MTRHIVFASPAEPSGASWLINCLLVLGVRVSHKPVVDRVWRKASPARSPAAMWAQVPGGVSLHPRCVSLRKWIPVFSERQAFRFRTDVEVTYVQDFADAQYDAAKAVFFVRDPRDALYSMYCRRQPQLALSEWLAMPDWRTLLDCVDHWQAHVRGWQAHPNIRFFRFEDYKADAAGLLAQISDWLDLRVSDRDIVAATAASTFERARAAEARYRVEYPQDREVANRAGQIGNWRESEARGALHRQVVEQAGLTLTALGYPLHSASLPAFTPGMRVPGACLQRLPFYRRIHCPAPADGANQDTLARLRDWAQHLDADLLARSGMIPDEIAALIDGLLALPGVADATDAVRMNALKQQFRPGSAHHFAQLRGLLHRQRTALTMEPSDG